MQAPANLPARFRCDMRCIHSSGALSTLGMTRLEVLCVLVVVVILASMIIPAGHDREKVNAIRCRVNLKNIGIAYRIFAEDNAGLFPFHVSTNQSGSLELTNDIAAQFRALSNELATPKIVLCPSLAAKVIAATNWAGLDAKRVGYFLNLSVSSKLTNSALSGDIGFTINRKAMISGVNEISAANAIVYPKEIHGGAGNIVTAGGHTARLKDGEWHEYLRASQATTNLFLLP